MQPFLCSTAASSSSSSSCLKRKLSPPSSPQLCTMMSAVGVADGSTRHRQHMHVTAGTLTSDHASPSPLSNSRGNSVHGGSVKSHRAQGGDCSMTSSPSEYSGDDDSFKRRYQPTDGSTFNARRAWSIHYREDSVPSTPVLQPELPARASRLPSLPPPPPPQQPRGGASPTPSTPSSTSSSVMTAGHLSASEGGSVLVRTTGKQRAAGLAGLSALSRRR